MPTGVLLVGVRDFQNGLLAERFTQQLQADGKFRVRSSGFRVSVIDNREAYANAERFPEAAEVLAEEYEDAFPKLSVNESAYIVIVTRGHRDDMRVLRWAITTRARYISMIGSRRKTISVVKELEKEGMSNDDFRKHIQDQLATIKLIDQEVKAKTPPPGDDEIKALFETLDAILKDKPIPGSHTASELEELKALAKAVERRFSERVRARHILVRISPNASKEEKDAALKKIKEAQARLKKGDEFAELAKKYSDDPGSKDHGGDLGYFSRGDMVPAFDKAAFGLAVGQTSDIVMTDFGYHIIQVQEKKAAAKMSLDEIKDDLREYLFQQRGAKRFESYVKDLRSKADIKVNNLE